MTISKAAAIAGGLMFAMAVGVSTGQRIVGRHRGHPGKDATPAVQAITQEAAASGKAAAVVGKGAVEPADAVPAVNAVSVAGRGGTRAVLTTKPAAIGTVLIPPTEPALHERLRPLLNSGTDLRRAAAGFADAEQFAAVAHAARNTNVPFMVLKYRVVTQGKSLSDAIGELRSDVDAAIEAERAIAEARSDLSRLAL